MCTDQPYCLVPFIYWHDGEPVCHTRISLTTRSGVHSITGPFIMCEFDHANDWWNAWTPCDFPAALVQLGIPAEFSHEIMETVTDELAVSPSVIIALDGGLLHVELLPSPIVNSN